MNYNRDLRCELARPRLGASLVATALIALLVAFGFSRANAQTAGLAGLPQAPVAPSQSAPKAVALNPTYDFGTTLNGNTIKHTFKIRNEGTGTLIIGGTTTSCGCTAAKPTKEHVAAGQESDIDVTFDTRGEKGSVERIITVFTNDPANAQLKMTLKGEVKQQTAATPQEVSFGIVKRGSELQRTVMIKDLMKDTNFKVGPITNSNHNIAVSELAPAEGKQDATLKVMLLKSMPVGTFADTVKVATSRGPLDVLVFGTVAGDLSVNPPQVSFGIVPHHATALRMIKLTNSGSHPVQVLGVTSSNSSVAAAVEPIKPGKEYKITLELRGNTPDGQLRGNLAVRTTDPAQRTVNVPFFGIVGAFRG
ncbi:MAG: DUF1573 domain-containing protein [Candidatus Binataceae bacterium]